ncbi:MAG: CRISPR-associated protein Cas5 [Desulfobacterales bacterium]|nr:CRISPR-associated protein Cas5 [Desulfobacterales bacterium]
MKLISFQLSGRYGHFLKAECAVSALSYPVPPRTVILGIIGAVLGLEKDQPQQILEPAHIAIRGILPQTHWHKAKVRKDPPASLPMVIKKTQKGTADGKPEKAALIWQEWLFKPNYTIWISLPEPHLTYFEKRLVERRWYFQPCLGVTEMMADLNHLKSGEALALPESFYDVSTVFSPNDADLDMDKVFENKLSVHALRMPRTVSPNRIFSHTAYFIERNARYVQVKTDKAFKFGNEVLLFL